MLSSLIVILFLQGCSGYRSYRDSIPNGRAVPHPCVQGAIWEGVGHQNQAGAAERNPFGRDFGLNGKKWDECLCRTDSDGDGRTNGEELGDPDCVWKVGDDPISTEGLSHPGVCEPIDSVECAGKNAWEIECVEPGFHCEPLTATEDRENKTLSISEINIPAALTTYMCQFVEFQLDRDYHIIGSEPDLVNEELTHHIVMYGCPDDNAAEDAKKKYTNPGQCTMYDHGCQKMMILWTVGYYGTCFGAEYGLKIGPNGFKCAVIEVHYTNPEQKVGLKDASGLLLHYTPSLRDNDAGRFFAAPNYLELAPYQSEQIADGGCPAECTNHMFDEPIYITEIVPHMHYLGYRMIVEHRRNHTLVEVLVEEDNYDYDSPKAYAFTPPYKIEPGDEIYTRCHFNTSDRATFTYYGFSTYDEMCFPLTLYYPAQVKIRDCFTTNEIGGCGIFAGRDKAPECLSDVNAFFSEAYDTIYADLELNCDPSGIDCLPGCREAIDKAREHPCLKEGVDFIVLDLIHNRAEYTDDFIQMMASCDYVADTRMIVKRLDNTVKELSCEGLGSNGWQMKPFMLLCFLAISCAIMLAADI